MPAVGLARGDVDELVLLNVVWRPRSVEMELWAANFLDVLEPACIAFDGRASGEFLFGYVTANLDCSDTPGGGGFTWHVRNKTVTTRWKRPAAADSPNSKMTAR